MIQLNDLIKELTDVLDNDLQHLRGTGILGLTLPSAKPIGSNSSISVTKQPNENNTPFIAPIFPASSPSIQW
jgi:hypothetical protein